MREGPRFCIFDRRTQRKRVVDRLFDVRSHVFTIIAGYELDLYFDVVHFAHGCHRNLKLVHACKLADYVFDGRWINVYTADRHHVVAAAQEPSVETRESTPASARSKVQPHEIPSTVTDDRESRSTQICDYQFADLTGGRFLAGLRVDYFGNKFAFDDMNSTGLKFAFKAVRAYF